MKVHVTAVKYGGFAVPTLTAYLNGSEVAWIGDGQSLDIDAPTGENELVFKAGIRKASVRFISTTDVNVSLKWNRLSGKLQVLCIGSDVKVIA